ncbi:rRNA maturation RNase YbeY [Leptospira sp. 2 VSF19]|uniref:Endoribonuclease YbeY n=1 Tax=Leptospira soteropolitanensis TaxID=2950025 RepID=A0AAW5VL17_9LEPT|nr:rRNA maturation RNase YbeY [Leptospira soteropolitanensis]MCW7493094.1 rRNA maturation RNase YbeY [Leptospira soteropolitanensis]MCW7500837.1 rRNA maturation RNase YbeY [Leptospira soteropolitanensis]MCW7522944.1 rRNA maturation RNase YbeY [Leptospira soteropolitanensis]MCW7526949.1 rRNA maturation RNase YbeY [Leptospira soteropolitanensis]MCW7530662.1 rRNA maturation RNase YbeY [Leptospira soteropolitanensis]
MNPSLSVLTHLNDQLGGKSEVNPDLVIKNAEIILKYLSPSFLQSLELSILLVDDRLMKEINLERRGLNKTTDVLSFPLYSEFPPIPIQILGEVVISMDTCQKQAKEIGHSLIDEFYRLLVHGILHLFGYDHETNEEDAICMRKKEDECLELVFER